MLKLRNILVAAVLAVIPVAVVAADEQKLTNVSYDPTRELYEGVNALFAEHYQATAGKAVTVEQSHGGSSK